ncbi:MAG: sel1 repeat family protein, partial [Lachnospiraceae bacterium]|nr:sel1 repeat family protein [Lachnospiraceae bacterium]
MRKERIKAIIFSVCLIFGVLGLVIFKSDQLGFLLSLIFIILGVVNGKNIYEEMGDLIRDIKKNSRNKNVHKEIEKNFEEGQQCLMENQPNRAVECFGLVIQIGTEEEEFRQYAIDALDLLATLYDTGRVKQSVVEVNKQKAVSYYEQLVQFSDKPVYYEKLGDIQMDWQNYSKALDFYREAADFGSQYAMERLAHIYEDGITKQDPVTFMTQKVLPCNLNIALEWYRKLDNKGNPVGKSGINRIEAMLSNKDYLEKRALEEQLDSIERQRELDKVKTCYNVEPITQFTYELKENKVDNYVMQFPIGFKEFFDEEIDQPYFSKAGEENAYRLYVDYVCVPSESPRTIESY